MTLNDQFIEICGSWILADRVGAVIKLKHIHDWVPSNPPKWDESKMTSMWLGRVLVDGMWIEFSWPEEKESEARAIWESFIKFCVKGH